VINEHGTGADCDYSVRYYGGGINWDLDFLTSKEGDVDDPVEFSCADSPTISIPDLDYLGWGCLGTGESNNRATEYDWLRFWWDWRTNHTPSLTLYDIQILWNAAHPETWTASGDETGDTGGTYPRQRFKQAAWAFSLGDTGFLHDWNTLAADEGVGR
jgi:hypothetical protein